MMECFECVTFTFQVGINKMFYTENKNGFILHQRKDETIDKIILKSLHHTENQVCIYCDDYNNKNCLKEKLKTNSLTIHSSFTLKEKKNIQIPKKKEKKCKHKIISDYKSGCIYCKECGEILRNYILVSEREYMEP